MMGQLERPVTTAIESMIFALIHSEFPDIPVEVAVQTIVCIRVHPSVYASLVKEMREVMTVKDNEPYLYDIHVVRDSDVWISLENRPRLGWP